MLGKIAVEWEVYRRGVIPADATGIQITESRRAFYAGAHALFMTLVGMLDPGSEPTQQDLMKMDSIHNELEQFGKDVKAGKA